MVTSALELQHNSRKRNAETNSHTSYISKVHPFKKSYTIILNYLLIHLNQHVKWFSLGEVKKKTLLQYYREILGENPLDMYDFLLDKEPHVKQLQFLI